MEISDLINMLLEQNKSFIEQNKNYKEMLFFSITSIITILVIFLTANFFTMRKFREEEKEKIKLEVIQQLEQDKLQNIKQALSNELILLVDNKFQNIEININSLKQKASEINSKITSENNKTKNNINEIEGNLLQLKADLFFEQKSYTNAFTYYIESGIKYLSNTSTGSGHINGLLNKIEKTVKNITSITSWDWSSFDDFESKLPSKFDTQCKKIKSIMLTNSSND